MARKKKPAAPKWVDGRYLVTPPPFGCINRILGNFEDGGLPREVLLSASQAAEFGGPDHPFKLELVVDAPPTLPEE